MSNRFELLSLAALVSFYIYDDRIAISNSTHSNCRYDELKSVKCLTMSPDKHRKIISRDIEDQLTIITLILIDCYFTYIEVFQNILQGSYGRIGDAIKLFVCQLDRLLFDGALNVLFSHVRLLLSTKISKCFT